MNELEDKKLSEHIRSVFEEFEDEGAAAGWQELRRSYPSRKKRPLILWLSSAAAILTVLTSLWFWKGWEPVSEDPGKADYARIDKPSNLGGRSSEELKPSGPKETELDPDNEPLVKPDTRADRAEKLAYRTPSESRTHLAGKEASPEKTEMIAQVDLQSMNAAPGEMKRSALQSDLTLNEPETEALNSDHSLRDAATSLPTGTDKEIAVTAYGQRRFAAQNPNSALNDVGSDDAKNTKKTSEKKISFAVVGGSYFNFAEGSEASLNFSAGLASDIRLTRNLKLSTGLSLATNNLYFEHGAPSSKNLDYFSAPLYSGNPGSNFVNTAAEYSARLLNLDIPLNLKYIAGKNGFFISGGLSSGVYLSENYTMAYRTFDLSNSSYQTDRSADKVRETFSGVDFVKTLNISFGSNFRFGKKQTISIEPFLKYPLQGLGAQDLRFGASGVHLRLNFNSSKP